MTHKKKVIIGDCTLYLGDCMEVMPTLGKVDAVVTDPPYGIGADKGKSMANYKPRNGFVMCREYKNNIWDHERPDKQIFDLIREISTKQIIWGGNYFADFLPAQGKWFWWDKCQTMPTYGDGEMAWTNLSGTTPKKYTLSNNKLFAQRVERHHPTQKPLALMQWCLSFIPNAETILDPFMGSGSTGVACVKEGRKFIGIELDEEYFNIGCKRIEDAYRQADMFTEQPAIIERMTQDNLI